jgi:hypothetical protein
MAQAKAALARTGWEEGLSSAFIEWNTAHEKICHR